MERDGFSDAVVVDRVQKWYRVYASPMERVKRLLGRSSRHLDFRALDEITFSVTPGTALGVIGENGAGKSTLLKIVAGTTQPTLGSVEVRGVVSAILELGAAFHPEFSGRENAILYGALMGLERASMEERLAGIFAFAELGSFIEHPVKSYSTGMAMRLAFAVATHVDPDVLIVDEALAVGDGYFQKKCVDKIQEIRDRGTTILFCSHSMYYVSLFCNRVIWLKNGRMEGDGSAQEVVTAYEEFLVNRERRRLDGEAGGGEAEASIQRGQKAAIRAIRVRELDGREVETYRPGMDLEVEVEWQSADRDAEIHVGVAIERGDGTRLVGVATFLDGLEPLRADGTVVTSVVIRALPVAKGTYSVTGFLFDRSGLHIWDQVVAKDRLRPASDEWAPALLQLEHEWRR